MKPKVVHQTGYLQDESSIGGTLSTPFLGKELLYDSTVNHITGHSHPYISDDNWVREGEAAKQGKKYDMPFKIRGNPLGCGCREAFLHAIGEPTDGQIECDYMCDAGWHNYVVYDIREKQKAPPKKHVQIDKFGQPMVGDSFKAGELETL